jgi:hypothetical protein
MQERYIYISRSRLCVYVLLAIIITGGIVHIFDVFAMEGVLYNRPIQEYVREVNVFEQKQPMNIIDTKGQWISRGEAKELTPMGEIK